MEQLGLVHIYCGEGKGKTTAAVGLSLRAAGNGIPVLFVQFLKDGSSGEVKMLEHIKGIRVMNVKESYGFVFRMTEQEKSLAAGAYTELFRQAAAQCSQGMVLVLDEIMAACGNGLVSWEMVMAFLKERPQNIEVIMTGRDPSPELKEAADYITEMKKIKHPFDKGISARHGIEL